ncbi:hypothetical protein [Sporosarcina sp. FSL K6-5500]|uniref:hypothetical protein n=1 Tax=Sporosarcina sp. FSL K6-5500 TaxID=2921558 RepID=UPI0030F8C577
MKKVAYLFLLVLVITIAGCSDSGNDSSVADEKGVVEGIEVNFDLLSNNQIIDESMLEITITNTTDKTYIGKISFSNTSSQYWDIDIENLPPGKKLIREIKNGYNKHPEDGINYKVKGELSDKGHVSGVEYKLFKTDSERAFNVQTKNITKETVIEITREIYAEHGDNLVNLSFYGEAQTLKDGENPDAFPEASYIGSKVSKTITLGDDSFDFIPQ